MNFTSAATGFALSLSLIVAIGAQNAFVLRQGLRREHVGAIVLFCWVADGLLMVAGVAGLAQVLGGQPALARVLTAAGALFLAAYGVWALWRATRAHALKAEAFVQPLTRMQVLLQLAGFTLLNPHVYLDTVLLLGSVGAQQPGHAKLWFTAGAVLASGLWFASLGYGARWLAPVFAKPRAWQALDALIGMTMLALAGMLAMQLMP
jgi:L-lysine exporter family protein LysE/ArgO